MFAARSYARWAVPLALALTALGAAAPQATAAPSPVRDDVNGDGYQDLVVAAPQGTVGGRSRAGYVVVMYGGPHGLSTTRRSVISRATTGIPGIPAKGERFGAQLSKGDLNGDGFADVASAAPGEDAGNGAVWVLRGRPTRVVTDAALVFGGKAIGAPYAKAGFGSVLR